MAAPYPPNTIIGVVDSRHNNLDDSGQTNEVYSVSIRPINDDRVTGTHFGQTLAYTVAKEDYDMVKTNDIVVATISPPTNADIVKVVSGERWIREECVGPLASDAPDAPAEHYCVFQ